MICVSTSSRLNAIPFHENPTLCLLVDQLIEPRLFPFVLKGVNVKGRPPISVVSHRALGSVLGFAGTTMTEFVNECMHA